MSRLLSVSLTEDQVVARTKDVTRRLGWWENKHGRRLLVPGDELTLCRKVMGRKKGEPLVRLAQVEVVDVRREPLALITDKDVAREGFPGWTRHEFIAFFVDSMRCHPSDLVTRIEWRYLDSVSTITWDAGAGGERWIDVQGDVWSLGGDGLMHTKDTRPFDREHVERKWGPLRHLPSVMAAEGEGGLR